VALLNEVGALLDSAATHGGRTAEHHLLWIAQSNGIGRCRVREVLTAVGLSSAARQRVAEFSLGMRQRPGRQA